MYVCSSLHPLSFTSLPFKITFPIFFPCSPQYIQHNLNIPSYSHCLQLRENIELAWHLYFKLSHTADPSQVTFFLTFTSSHQVHHYSKLPYLFLSIYNIRVCCFIKANLGQIIFHLPSLPHPTLFKPNSSKLLDNLRQHGASMGKLFIWNFKSKIGQVPIPFAQFPSKISYMSPMSMQGYLEWFRDIAQQSNNFPIMPTSSSFHPNASHLFWMRGLLPEGVGSLALK